MKQQVALCVLTDALSLSTVNDMLNHSPFDHKKIIIIVDEVVPPNTPEHSHLQRQLQKLSNEKNIKLIYGQETVAQYVAKWTHAGQVVIGTVPTIFAGGINGGIGVCVSEEEMKEIYSTGRLPDGQDKLSFSQYDLKIRGETVKDVALGVMREWKDTFRSKNVVLTVDQDQLISWSAAERTELLLTLAGSKISGISLQRSMPLERSDQPIFLSKLIMEGDCWSSIQTVANFSKSEVKAAFVGGAAGGSFENIRMLAEHIRGRKIAFGRRLGVAPASADIYIQAANAGYITEIMEAGGIVLNQCARPSEQFKIGPDEVMLTNDYGYSSVDAGTDATKIITTSVEVIAEAILEGKIGERDEGLCRQLTLEGRCWTLLQDDIDTDIIIPTQYLTLSHDEMLQHAFEPLRPELASLLKEGDILIGGDNFGCGSSREMAAEVIADHGVRCIIAKSFARIFFRNAINNGILLIENDQIQENINEGDVVCVVCNQYIEVRGRRYPIGKVQDHILEIIRDGGLVKHIQKDQQNNVR